MTDAASLVERARFEPRGFAWDVDRDFAIHDPAALAHALWQLAASGEGVAPALALEAIAHVVAHPTSPWSVAFTAAALDQPARIATAALSYAPPVPLGLQYHVDCRSDAYLSKHRAADTEAVASSILVGLDLPAAHAEAVWWSVQGGSVGIASRLVRHAPAMRTPLIAATRTALEYTLPFWARAWMVEHLAREDKQLLAVLQSYEQEPWLAAHMNRALLAE